MNYSQKYKSLRSTARITHSNVNIKGGNYFQDEIYEAILATGKHKQVKKDHPLPLYNKQKSRKEHKVDVLIIEDDYVLAINSKGKSFNNTKSEDSELDEYLWYVSALEKDYPDKKVSYIIFKDEYRPSDPKMKTYHFLNKNGILVYNTEEYMISNYNIEFKSLEERRQKRAVDECERGLIKEGVELEVFYRAIAKLA